MHRTFLKPDLPVYQFHLLEKFSDQIGHAVFTREGGVSKPPFDSLNVRFTIGDNDEDVRHNRQRIFEAFKFKDECIISANQTHGKNVVIIDEEFLHSHTDIGSEIENVDAFITAMPGYIPMVQVADCQALLMYDPYKNVVAAIHAGWKGLAQDISGETLGLMKSRFGVNPRNVLVGIAPSLGPCCAFFTNPQQELPANFEPFIDRKKRVDLWAYSMAQLEKHGIHREYIENASLCTNCENGRRTQGTNPHFYSFRADKGVTGRFGVMVWVK